MRPIRLPLTYRPTRLMLAADGWQDESEWLLVDVIQSRAKDASEAAAVLLAALDRGVRCEIRGSEVELVGRFAADREERSRIRLISRMSLHDRYRAGVLPSRMVTLLEAIPGWDWGSITDV